MALITVYTTMDVHVPMETRCDTRCPGGSSQYLRHELPIFVNTGKKAPNPQLTQMSMGGGKGTKYVLANKRFIFRTYSKQRTDSDRCNYKQSL